MIDNKVNILDKGNILIEQSLEYIKDKNYISFFELFFNVLPIYVEEYNTGKFIYELTTWTTCGLEFTIKVHEEDLKSDFQKYVEDFNVDNVLNERILCDKPYREDLKNFHKWLVMVSNLMDGIAPQNEEVNRTENNYNPITVKVLTFSKRTYDKKTIESKTDKEKYLIALNDKENCRIMDANEYTRKLNEFRPMETCVYTYIVGFFTSPNGLCTQMSNNI